MALSLHRAQLFAASAQLAFGPLNRDSGAGARAGWVLEDPDGYCTKEHCRDWKNPGSETIPAGTMQKKFLPSVDASGATTIRGDTRAYLVLDHAETAWPKHDYARIDLQQGPLSFELDVSGVPCGCIACVYLVAMPEPTADGSAYCDTNAFLEPGLDGGFCTEVDLMEANVAPRRSGSKGRRGKESRPLRSSGRRDRDVEM